MSFFVGIAMFVEHHLLCNKDLLQSALALFFTQLVCLCTHPDGIMGGLWVHFCVVCVANALTLHAFHLSHLNYTTMQ